MSKILLFDIETSPNVVLSFQIGRRINLSHENIIQERKIICIGYKWLGEKQVHHLQWDSKQSDKQMLINFAKILKEAELVIYQNGDRFDIRHINARMAYHGLSPLDEIPSEDTLKQSRKVFALNSHRLDYMGDFFGVGRKLHTDFGLWRKVFFGDLKALAQMVRYCKNDVLLLEKVYNKIQPYTRHTHHRGILEGNDSYSCKACGSEKTKWNGFVVYRMGMYRRRACNACGHKWRTNMKSFAKEKEMKG